LIKLLFKSFFIFNIKKKKEFTLLVFVTFVCALIEIICLYMLYGLIEILVSREISGLYVQNEIITKVFLYFNINNNFINFIKIIIFLYSIKFFLFLFLFYFQYYFINSTRVFLSSSLFQKYLKKEYLFHLRNNSSLLFRNVENEVGQFCLGVIQSLLIILTEVLIFLGIITVVVSMEPKISLIALGLLIFLGVGYFLVIKKIISKQGIIRQVISEKIIRVILESLKGIKDIKIFNAERFFYLLLKNNLKKLAKANIIVGSLSQFPKLSLEFLIIVFLCGFLFLSNLFFEQRQDTLQTLGLFALASFKIIPSISKIILSMQNLRFNSPSINLLNHELKKDSDIAYDNFLNDVDLKINPKKIILQNVSFKYESRENFVLKNISFSLKEGKCTGIVGSSGSGKSTLLNIIMGLVPPTSGQILIDDKDLYSNPIFLNQWNKIIGYVPQKINLLDASIKNNIAFGFLDHEIKDNLIVDCLKKANLYNFVNTLNKNIDTIIGEDGCELSGGQIQRIALARALYKNSKLLIFDEPTSSLDKVNELEVFKIINELKITSIIVSHSREILDFCDCIYEIKDSKILKLNYL